MSVVYDSASGFPSGHGWTSHVDQQSEKQDVFIIKHWILLILSWTEQALFFRWEIRHSDSLLRMNTIECNLSLLSLISKSILVSNSAEIVVFHYLLDHMFMSLSSAIQTHKYQWFDDLKVKMSSAWLTLVVLRAVLFFDALRVTWGENIRSHSTVTVLAALSVTFNLVTLSVCFIVCLTRWSFIFHLDLISCIE